MTAQQEAGGLKENSRKNRRTRRTRSAAAINYCFVVGSITRRSK
jgi:hypothetical protein